MFPKLAEVVHFESPTAKSLENGSNPFPPTAEALEAELKRILRDQNERSDVPSAEEEGEIAELTTAFTSVIDSAGSIAQKVIHAAASHGDVSSETAQAMSTAVETATGAATIPLPTVPTAPIPSLEPSTALVPVAEEQSVLQEFMRVQGAVSALYMALSETAEAVQLNYSDAIALIDTISKLLSKCRKNQHDFRRMDGYSLISKLFDRIVDYTIPEAISFLQVCLLFL